jgi:hypothetical protein
MKSINALNIDVTEKVKVTDEIDMTLYEFSRWTSLIRGIDLIDSKARQLKVSLDNDKSWIKPLALQKYVDEETPSVVAEVRVLLDNEEV